MESMPPDAERLANALERDSAWLHRLARVLTKDPAAAADAAQATLVAAWQNSPEGRPPKRAWLARVLSNFLRQESRADHRRRAREERAARPDVSREAASSLERLELQRRIVDAVHALDEPYRTTIVLRFLDGLSVRAVASRTGVPTKTVYTRIERGLNQLRTRLDARFGNDRVAWLSALAAVPMPRIGWTEILTGALAMGTAAKVATTVGALTIGAVVILQQIEDSAGESVAAPATVVEDDTARAELIHAPSDEAERSATTIVAETEPTEEPETSASSSTPPPAEPDAATIVIRGHVRGVSGEPIPGVGVSVDGTTSDETTDGSGAFELTFDKSRLPVTLTLADDVYAAVREGHVKRSTVRRTHTIVAAERASISGWVVDEAGAPLEKSSVSIRFDEAVLVDFPGVLDLTLRSTPTTWSDEEGRFELPRAPLPEGTLLVVRRAGYEIRELELVRDAVADMRIALEPLPEEEVPPKVEGIVLLPDGEPAAGATVRYGQANEKADDDGYFSLPLSSWPEDEMPLAAGLEGYGPALVERYGELQRLAAPHAPAPVTLVLLESTLSIEGDVVDADGNGLEGWSLRLRSGTWVTPHQVPPVLAESLNDPRPATVDTAADGSFVFGGLLNREYTLVAHDPETLVEVKSEPVMAGTTGVRLVVPAETTHPHVAGRILSSSGEGVAGARVSVGRVQYSMGNGESWTSAKHVETEEDGYFELANVPLEGTFLAISGEDVVPIWYHTDADDDVQALEIEVALRCHFRVQVQGTDTTDLSVEVHDANGNVMQITTFSAYGSSGRTRRPLVDGQLEVSAVSDKAAWLALFRGEGSERELVQRQELALIPGEVVDVRFEL